MNAPTISRFFAVIFAPHASNPRPRNADFREWIRCDRREDINRLVLNRAMRDRYGFNVSPTETVEVAVFETSPLGALPEKATSANFTTYTIHPL